jgi:hypothetical protein
MIEQIWPNNNESAAGIFFPKNFGSEHAQKLDPVHCSDVTVTAWRKLPSEFLMVITDQAWFSISSALFSSQIGEGQTVAFLFLFGNNCSNMD